ncbi:GNAT family N-acetyltransferase [Rathayibacter sp. CAU 1779]
MRWTLRPSTLDDVDWIAELRAVVLRDDLTRLGRYDEVRVRQRLRDAFHPELTTVIVVDAEPVGSITVRPDADGIWIEHFYLDPAVQGRGIGTAVLASVLSEESAETATGPAGPHRLNVLQGSAARRLYERFGFTVDTEDAVDVFMSRRVPLATPHRRLNLSKPARS